jgi:pimeloyl-ACP methyl ester carboxylesterase
MKLSSNRVMDRLNQQIRLRDGRMLGFAEYGVPTGVPIVYFHGWPSSRLEPYAVREVCVQLGVRMIAADRPGFGLSDFQPGRTILARPRIASIAASTRSSST